MPRVVHFEISASNAERAIAFYSSVFGWHFTKWEGSPDSQYWLIRTGTEGEFGIDGGMFLRTNAPECSEEISGRAPAKIGHVNTIDVPAVDEYAERIVAGGGTVAMPKMSIPGVGYLMYFLDTEDSMFAIMQRDSNAV